MKIKTREVVGANCLTPEEGSKVFSLIHDPLARGEQIVLDFSDVHVVASAFLNTSVGRLYSDISADRIRENLRVENMTDIGLFTLKRVVDNAKHYYSNQAYKDAVDATLTSFDVLEA